MLDRDHQSRFQECDGGLEVHEVFPGFAQPDAWITTTGHLITTKYGEQFQHGPFCVETTTTGTIVALMCNPCGKKAQCIHLCCPHGQAFLPNADYDYNDYNSPSSVCVKVEGLEYHPEVWHKEEDRILEWERNQHYILIAPSLGMKESNTSVGFQCPEKHGGISWAPEDLGEFQKILENFWLNAMVIHIWLPFSFWSATIFKRTRRLFICCVYAQGLPLIICAITAIIDSHGKEKPSSMLHHYPEMGVYSCFLGSQKTSTRKSYFESPVFIYHQSVIILLQISNFVFLLLTGRHVCRPGDDLERNNKGRHLQNFHLFAKLFFILGFHWIAELVSTALGQEHGFEETFYARLFLDLVNLFAGVLIFLVLICNKQVLSSLKQRLCGQTNHDSRENIQMSAVQEHLLTSVGTDATT